VCVCTTRRRPYGNIVPFYAFQAKCRRARNRLPNAQILVLMLVRGGEPTSEGGRRFPKDVQDRLAEQSSSLTMEGGQ